MFPRSQSLAPALLLALSLLSAPRAQAQGALPPGPSLAPAPGLVAPPKGSLDELVPADVQAIVASLQGPDLTLEGRPLSLEEAYRMGRSHPALKAAREQVTQADLLDDRVLTFWKPRLSATGTYTHYNSEIRMAFPDFSTLQLDFTNPEMPFQMETRDIVLQKQDSFGGIVQLQAPIFVGPLLVELDNARQARRLGELQVARQERTFLLTPVAATYYGAVAAAETLQVARRTLATNWRHLDANRRMFDVGQGNRLSVLQAAMAVIDASQKLRRAETAWRSAQRNLELLLQTTGPLRLSHPPAPAVPPGDEAALLRRAEAVRPDLAATALAVEMAERSLDKFWWQFAPTLAANGMYRLSDSENFAGEKGSWQVGLALNLPLYDGGTRYVERAEASSKLRQAVEQREALRQQVAAELSEKLKAIEEHEANLLTTRHAVALAREGVAAAEASFAVGMATNLEVLDANTRLFEAEQGLVTLQILLDLARLQLAHAVGDFDPLATRDAVPQEEAK